MKRRWAILSFLPLLTACAGVGLQTPSASAPTTAAASPAFRGLDGEVNLSNAPAMTFRINPTHTGAQDTAITTRRLARRWSHTFPGPVSYPLVVDSRVFVTAASGEGATLYVLDARTGASVWGPVDLGGTQGFAAAAYDAGQLFVVNGQGLMQAFDATDGMLRWSAKLDGQYVFSSPPTGLNGVVFTGGAGSGGTLYANSERTGALLWSAPVMNGDGSAPAVTADTVYVSYACVQAYAFTPSSGTLLWHHEGRCEGGGGSTLALHQGKLYARDPTGNLMLDARSGKAIGAFSASAPPAFLGDTGFFLAGGTLRALNLSTNVVRWSFAGDGMLIAAPVAVGKTVFTSSSAGHVYALDASTGALVAAVDLGRTKQANAGEFVFEGAGLTVGNGLLLVPIDRTLLAY